MARLGALTTIRADPRELESAIPRHDALGPPRYAGETGL
jgi:hypothetical protein